MRLVIQRVKWGRVTVADEVVGAIGSGLVILAGITHTDTETIVQKMATKAVNLRIFSDAQGKMNFSALDVNANVLVVSQFTLYADARKGRRPSYTQAALPPQAEPLVTHFGTVCQQAGLTVSYGRFGADMAVELLNDGPVTIVLDSESLGFG